MGVYIFDWKILKNYLTDGEKDKSADDFGKDIIPKMLKDGIDLFAYRFKGYWKDVGTVESLWEANMDLIDPNNPLHLHDNKWKIYSVNPIMPPQYICHGGKVNYSLVVEGCIVCGEVNRSVLFYGVKVGRGSLIKDSVIMPNVVIEDNVYIERAIIGEGAVIKSGTKVYDESGEISLIEQGTEISPAREDKQKPKDDLSLSFEEEGAINA